MNLKIASADVSALTRSAQMSLILGAAGSLALTIYAGRHQHSVALLAMFVVWVLLPFVGLFASNRASPAAPASGRISLQIATVIICASSLLAYGTVALGPPHHNTAFIFIVFPAVSWLVIGVDLLIARKMSRARSSGS